MPSEYESRQVTYFSYLLRLWRGDQSATSGWRASLEDPRTGQRIGFANLEQLFAYLMEGTAVDLKYQPSPNPS